MTAAQVVLSIEGYPSATVNFTSLGVKVTHRISNPIIVIDTPRDNLLESNSVGINIGFVTEAFDLSFTLTDGLGALDWANPTTNYEKLFFMAYKINPKQLVIDGRGIYGHIENLTLPWEAGKADLSVNGSLSFRVTKNIEMELMDVGTGYTVTFSNGSVYIALNNASNIFGVGAKVEFTTTGGLPTNFSTGVEYWIVATSPTYFWVSATQTGQPISAGSAGTGVQKVKLA